MVASSIEFPECMSAVKLLLAGAVAFKGQILTVHFIEMLRIDDAHNFANHIKMLSLR